LPATRSVTAAAMCRVRASCASAAM
jgi:hypothetical protein